ncbi:HAD-IIB family hydrolase [Pontiella sp.]|uniref:HAD-IIB family hydrolase n=1 Tax=Pontiella sp. TaxID=2837462 RepID=UPI003568BB35
MLNLGAQARSFVGEYIRQERLPASYAETVANYFVPCAQRIQSLVRRHPGVAVVGINGAQGTGKSTFAGCLAGLLELQGLRVLVLSIDDLYFTRAVRGRLAKEIHPLLQTRGVPGTHEMELGQAIIAALRGEPGPTLNEVPRFDKGADDRAATGTPFPADGVDLILFEGWCIGAVPQPASALADPCNALERDHDPDGRWRTYVNDCLSGTYADVFGSLDYLLMLKPPGFEMVYQWRGEQEAKLRQRLAEAGASAALAMDEDALTFFISHYERLTRWMLEEMPGRADEVFCINAEHEYCAHTLRGDRPVRYLVSTDLDATLLDESYSWQPARPALEKLAEQGACLVLNSSKTVSELLQLAQEMTGSIGMDAPILVAENGGVLAMPDPAAPQGYRIECLGPSRSEILAVAHRLRSRHGYRFEGFDDMQPEEVVGHTGLDRDAAVLAMRRQATEPLLWHDTEARWAAFSAALNREGIRAVRGGRFIHLMGDTDKALGQRMALARCEERAPDALWRVIALGDSPNDRGMLDAADIAVVIKNPAHEAVLQPGALLCLFPPHTGPRAWNEAILSIVEHND